jgi:hypothetical protein
MNSLVFADVDDGETSMGNSIFSTMQQMSISFGIAFASLVTALFVPDRYHASAPQMVVGIHKAFVTLGCLTVLSTLIFRELRPGDGSSLKRAKAAA